MAAMTNLTKICNLNDIKEGDSKGFTLDGYSFFIVKKEEQISIFENWCPHLGIQLECIPDEFLDSDSQYIQCANHGALFDLEKGLCVAGPCSGKKLRAVEFKIEENNIFCEIPANQASN